MIEISQATYICDMLFWAFIGGCFASLIFLAGAVDRRAEQLELERLRGQNNHD